jgi:uncharacterized protein (TIGR00304 family)
MVPRHWIPIALFIGGFCTIFASVATGEADVTFLLIIPVFTGSSLLFLLGTGLILLSFVVGFVILAAGQAEVEQATGAGSAVVPAVVKEKRTSFGGVVLIGPIPIAFGSDRRMAVIMLVVGVVVAILLLGLALALF